ncbi:winged helix-turn-helix transcriptional regulator [Salmonirosea aquatica]|uniref:Transcriptional regulator n=1 Tax=Salmonirosea aquatica TaxID=2654236 RepID=A0A7C9BE06_9BACT|nr:transcriptional regulator [Cytophagaceae bacterium SJW1-29]
MTTPDPTLQQECSAALLPVRDALEVLGGNWKLPILIILSDRPKRFGQISRELAGISDEMLSKELKDLETNKLVIRTVHEAFPPKVEYKLTEYCHSLASVLSALKNWGSNHREIIMN